MNKNPFDGKQKLLFAINLYPSIKRGFAYSTISNDQYKTFMNHLCRFMSQWRDDIEFKHLIKYLLDNDKTLARYMDNFEIQYENGYING